jgi:hypothetical protein
VGYFSSLAADGQGQLHLVFTQNAPNDDCPVCYHVFHRWSHDNGLTWSNLTEISTQPTGAAKPQLLIDGQDNLHVVWEAGIGGAYGQLEDPSTVMYSASYDQGQTWTSSVEFISPNNWAKNISIGLDGDGQLLVAWLALPEDLVYYQVSSDQGRSWSPPRPIPDVWGGHSVFNTALDDYAMATDSAGNVHLALVGRTSSEQKSLSILHLSWDGSSWSSPEAVATLIGDVPEWPQIAVGNGNQLHLVWFVRDQAHIWDSDGQQYTIWYTQGKSSAPAVSPVAWSTSTPTPEPKVIDPPTPTPTPTLTPVPTPTLDPSVKQILVSPEVTESIYTDNDELLLLLSSLLPALLVVTVAVFVVRIWRR